jgi:hypothetical protein
MNERFSVAVDVKFVAELNERFGLTDPRGGDT